MFPPSSTTIPAGSYGNVTQEIKLTNSMQGQKNIMLKLKIVYKQGANTVSAYCFLFLKKVQSISFHLV